MTIFVSRAEWGARDPRAKPTPISTVKGVILHWTGQDPGLGVYPHTQCDDIVRQTQNYHMDTRGYNDIAYNALVCQHDYCYEGRWVGVQSAGNGDDSSGNSFNPNWYAVCNLMGVGDSFQEGSKVAYSNTCNILSAGTERHPHSWVHSTECPGDECRQWIAAGMPLPGQSPTPTPEEEEMSFLILRPPTGSQHLISDSGLDVSIPDATTADGLTKEGVKTADVSKDGATAIINGLSRLRTNSA